jgi:hypothetical protein
MYRYLFLVILIIVIIYFFIIPLWKQKPQEDFLTQLLNPHEPSIQPITSALAYAGNKDILMDKIVYNGNIIPVELKKRLLEQLFHTVLRKTNQRIVPVDVDYVSITKYTGDRTKWYVEAIIQDSSSFTSKKIIYEFDNISNNYIFKDVRPYSLSEKDNNDSIGHISIDSIIKTDNNLINPWENNTDVKLEHVISSTIESSNIEPDLQKSIHQREGRQPCGKIYNTTIIPSGIYDPIGYRTMTPDILNPNLYQQNGEIPGGQLFSRTVGIPSFPNSKA